MRFFLAVLLAASSALAISINTPGKDETAREKRQVLVLVPQPQPQFVLVPQRLPPSVTCGNPAFMCEGACVASNVGGITAVKGEFPWLAQIYSGGRQICGGSIVDNNYILTAASCVEPATPASVAALRIRVGDFKRDSREDGQFVERNVTVVYRHTDFVAAGKQPAVHDIALLKLSEPLVFTDYIRPICLDDAAPGRVSNGITEATISGYGVLSYSNRPATSDLFKVNTRIGTLQECANIYAANGVQLRDGQLCAGVQGGASLVDPCVGDNGGPLFVKVGLNSWRQVGIASFGLRCSGPPAIYTQVSTYRPWIDQVRTTLTH